MRVRFLLLIVLFIVVIVPILTPPEVVGVTIWPASWIKGPL